MNERQFTADDERVLCPAYIEDHGRAMAANAAKTLPSETVFFTHGLNCPYHCRLSDHTVPADAEPIASR